MKQIKFSCPDDLREEIRVQAGHEDASESAVIRRAVREYLRRRRANHSRRGAPSTAKGAPR